MPSFMDKLLKFINYWWFRYLMVTELYIVEKWERVVIHIILFILFLGVWYFNVSVILPLTSKFIPLPAFIYTSNGDRLATPT